jgi:hypothetical protein
MGLALDKPGQRAVESDGAKISNGVRGYARDAAAKNAAAHHLRIGRVSSKMELDAPTRHQAMRRFDQGAARRYIHHGHIEGRAHTRPDDAVILGPAVADAGTSVA